MNNTTGRIPTKADNGSRSDHAYIPKTRPYVTKSNVLIDNSFILSLLKVCASPHSQRQAILKGRVSHTQVPTRQSFVRSRQCRCVDERSIVATAPDISLEVGAIAQSAERRVREQ